MRSGYVAAAALLVVITLGGCSDDQGDGDDGTAQPDTASSTAGEMTFPSDTPSSAGTETSSGTAEGDVADALAALATAAGAVPDGQPFDVERETEDGQRVWEVKVASQARQFTVDVSPDGSEVISQREVQSPDDDIQKLQGATVDAAEAVRTAAEAQAGTLSELEIDTTRDGTVIWQVDLRQADGTVVELTVDASSGEVVRRSTDD